MTSFEDGPNANHVAMDYQKKSTPITKGQTVQFQMAKSGGWAAIIE